MQVEKVDEGRRSGWLWRRWGGEREEGGDMETYGKQVKGERVIRRC